jgi:hypothetical protein
VKDKSYYRDVVNDRAYTHIDYCHGNTPDKPKPSENMDNTMDVINYRNFPKEMRTKLKMARKQQKSLPRPNSRSFGVQKGFMDDPLSSKFRRGRS